DIPWGVLDLSVASAVISGDGQENAAPRFEARFPEANAAPPACVWIGRYNEPRLLYTAPQFAADASPLGDRRTIHLGLDFLTAPGEPVFAPLDGNVHALANNTAPQDYGPVVILSHQTEDGHRFFTLYGHLSLWSLENLQVGQSIAAGQLIGKVGATQINGGWP